MAYTLGSLFDGSGGFPLAGSLCGIEPKWAAEVEPYPIAVTRSRFPNMKHLGDISKVSGAEIEPVDIITFGSPCQDLSVAGKRAGLKHEDNGDEETTRSGLFMEAVRIIKEMREKTNGVYPKVALWENVPGAFSSNGGADFRIVLEELIKIVEPKAVMPEIPKNGWPYADSYCGDGWSLAYRVFDAQFWGVPQRRRRIHLVLHLAGERAGEILFEREGLRGNPAESGAARQGAAGDAEDRSGAADRADEVTVYDSSRRHDYQPFGDVCETRQAHYGTGGGNAPIVVQSEPVAYNGENITSPLNKTDPQPGDPCHTLGTDNRNYVVYPINDKATRYKGGGESRNHDGSGNGFGVGNPGDPSPTLTSGDRHIVAYSFDSLASNSMKSKNPHSGCREVEVAKTLDTTDPNPCKNQGGIAIVEAQLASGKNSVGTLMAYSVGNGQLNQISMSEQCNTLDCMHDKQAVLVSGVDCRNATEIPEATNALQAVAGHSLNGNAVVRVQYLVRRLTPTECARLQGFADYWGVPDHKDEFTEEEYHFWHEVRNTHARINGKTVRDYTPTQMLTWYNKLHSDGAEYKMWGNGIALPPALYCMQGIREALDKSCLE